MEKMTFYRYIRPVKFDSSRMELVTQPRGGVCLRFEPVGNSLLFTHARCHPDDLFSRTVAKNIVDGRARSTKEMLENDDRNLEDFISMTPSAGMPLIPYSASVDALVDHVVEFGLSLKSLVTKQTTFSSLCLAMEHVELAAELLRLKSIHAHESQKLKSATAAVEKRNIKQVYDHASR